MKIGWLADDPGYIGGAELTQRAFKNAAPEGIEIVVCRTRGAWPRGLDRYVIHNCVSYEVEDLAFDVPSFKYWHDVGPFIGPDKWEAMNDATHICVSPLQRSKMNVDAELIPPMIDLKPFRAAAKEAGERKGSVCVGPFMGPGKNPARAAEWAQGNGGIDFYGEGPWAPDGSRSVPHDEMPRILARYKTYVHLPRELEPCGRSTIEAWAAGCDIVVNGLEGARHWITKEPEKLETAAQDFWSLVLE